MPILSSVVTNDCFCSISLSMFSGLFWLLISFVVDDDDLCMSCNHTCVFTYMWMHTWEAAWFLPGVFLDFPPFYSLAHLNSMLAIASTHLTLWILFPCFLSTGIRVKPLTALHSSGLRDLNFATQHYTEKDLTTPQTPEMFLILNREQFSYPWQFQC